MAPWPAGRASKPRGLRYLGEGACEGAGVGAGEGACEGAGVGAGEGAGEGER